MTPTHVQIYRCAGGCHSSPGLTQCVPSLTRTKTIPVMLARCGLGPGLCHKECATISVEEDSECECDCVQEERDLCQGKESHKWLEDVCECQCRDSQVRLEETGGRGESNLIIVQGRRDCEERGQHWDNEICTCQSLKIELSQDLNNRQPHHYNNITSSEETEAVSITREIIVILLLSTINSCLVVIVVLLVARLRTVSKTVRGEERREEEWCEVRDDSALRGPRPVSHKTYRTYSDIDIYSASSGFVSECSASQETGEPYYQAPETIREKKYQLKETYQELPRASPGDETYDRAMRSIEETLQMLKDSADKL